MADYTLITKEEWSKEAQEFIASTPERTLPAFEVFDDMHSNVVVISEFYSPGDYVLYRKVSNLSVKCVKATWYYKEKSPCNFCIANKLVCDTEICTIYGDISI